jgi:hypothetical protein
MIWAGTQANSFDDIRQEHYIRLLGTLGLFSLALFLIAYLYVKIKNKRQMYIVISVIAFMSFILIFPFAITPDRIPFRYTYESSDGGFSMYEHKGGKTAMDMPIGFSDIKRKFAEYVKKTGKKDVVLCRTFKKDDRIRWHHFYAWLSYNTQERWQCPYKAPEDLKAEESE